MPVEIRPITAYSDYKAAEQLQQDVLEFEPIDVVPYSILQSFALSGGAVIGAFDDGKLIGVVMGYIGLLPDGTPYHRSQRMAVLASYRGQGIGAALKHAQADVARRYGLRLMCWTYDPLRALNAHLNLHKLGGFSRRYIENAYAVSASQRDAGAPIDRLWVEWNLATPAQRPAPVSTAYAVQVVSVVGNMPSPPDLSSTAPVLIIEIPQDIDAVRASGIERLRAWRMATRRAFTHYLAAGYVVADYQRDRGYVLTQA